MDIVLCVNSHDDGDNKPYYYFLPRRETIEILQSEIQQLLFILGEVIMVKNLRFS